MMKQDTIDDDNQRTDSKASYLMLPLKKKDSGEAEVSVTFMTDEEIQEVNAEYRGKECTDRCNFICT